MRPDRRVVSAYLLRGLYIWLGARACMTVVFLYGGMDAFRLPAASMLELVLVSVVLCFLDTRRRRERALLGNLAMSSGSLTALFAGPAIVGELAIHSAAMSA